MLPQLHSFCHLASVNKELDLIAEVSAFIRNDKTFTFPESSYNKKKVKPDVACLLHHARASRQAQPPSSHEPGQERNLKQQPSEILSFSENPGREGLTKAFSCLSLLILKDKGADHTSFFGSRCEPRMAFGPILGATYQLSVIDCHLSIGTIDNAPEKGAVWEEEVVGVYGDVEIKPHHKYAFFNFPHWLPDM
jgi:hypothetical protein